MLYPKEDKDNKILLYAVSQYFDDSWQLSAVVHFHSDLKFYNLYI